MTEEYLDLLSVTDAVYRTDMARLSRLNAEERTLRNALEDLDRQLRDSLSGAHEDAPQWHAIGADEAWRKWLMRRRSETNVQLARLLATRAEAVETLRRSFARKQVSEEIVLHKAEEARLNRLRQI